MHSNATRVARVWWMQSVLSGIIWAAALGDIFFWIWRGWGDPLRKYFIPFQDLTIYRTRFGFIHRAEFFQPYIADSSVRWQPAAFAYPPAAAFLYHALYKAAANPVFFYLVLTAIWCALCAFAATKLLVPVLPANLVRLVLSASLLLFSFPALFLAERANLEIFVWIFITSGVLLYLRGHWHGAAILFGLAAAVKIYPILLFGVFLKSRRGWPALLTALASAIAATLLAAWYCGPHLLLALHGFVDGIVRFKSDHAEAARVMEAPFDHSLFAGIKALYLFRDSSAPLTWGRPYYIIAGSATVLVFLLRVRHLPFLNRLTFLSIAMVILPPASYAYTLVHLYVPLLGLGIVLLHACRKQQEHIRTSSLVAFGCLLLSMTPINILANGHFLYAGLIQGASLLCVTIATAIAPWQMPDLPPWLSRRTSLPETASGNSIDSYAALT